MYDYQYINIKIIIKTELLLILYLQLIYYLKTSFTSLDIYYYFNNIIFKHISELGIDIREIKTM